jgi:hypothetical protein
MDIMTNFLLCDLTTYSTAKAAGQVVVSKLNDTYVWTAKRFDPGTGQPVEPLVQTVDKANVQAQIATFQDRVASLTALLADLKALG